MKKNWICRREKTITQLLSKLGVSSLYELGNSFLLIHVSYGGDEDGGRTVLVKVQRVYFRNRSMSFEFPDSPIEIDLDGNPKIKLGGDLKGVGQSDLIYIETLSYSLDGWIAINSHDGVWAEIKRNLDVKVVSA